MCKAELRRIQAIKAMSKYTNHPKAMLIGVGLIVIGIEFTIAGLLVYGGILLFS